MPSSGRHIEIRLSRGPAQATVQWPVSETGACVAWLASGCDDPCRCDLAGHRAAGHARRHRDGVVPGGSRVRFSPPSPRLSFVNRRANHMTVMEHDGIGVWLAARRLNRGRFVWADALRGAHLAVDGEQWQALGWACPGSMWARQQRSRCCSARQSAKTPIPPRRALRHTVGHEYRISGSP